MYKQMTDEALTLWETVIEAEQIVIRDVESLRVVAIIPGTDAQAQADARLIAASGYLLRSLKGMIAWGDSITTEEDESDRETPLKKARLAAMVATGRVE